MYSTRKNMVMFIFSETKVVVWGGAHLQSDITKLAAFTQSIHFGHSTIEEALIFKY